MADKKRPFAMYSFGESMSKQSFKDECDINQIIDRARSGADISHLNSRVARYGDFTDVPDYKSALNVVREADALFMSLDAKVRERFANDPARLLDFLSRPENREEAVRLGLVDKPAPKAGDTPLESNARPAGDDRGLDSVESTEPPSAHEVKAKKGGSK